MNTTKKPQIDLASELTRLSDNGQGPVEWSICTPFSLDEILGQDFLPEGSRHGLRRLDFVRIVASSLSPRPVVANALVTGAGPGQPTKLQIIGQPTEIVLENLSPFELLGLSPKATTAEIETSFRKLSKKLHPDAGGDKKGMQDLSAAKEQALKLASALRAVA